MHIHILGICGTFMAGVARLAVELGHCVTGSDQNVYPPMSDQLNALGVKIFNGYSENNLNDKPDLCVIGNALSRGNPEVEYILRTKCPFVSGPEWLRAFVLAERDVIAVAGTHGKTTTSSMLAWILKDNHEDCGYLIGGVPENFKQSADLGKSNWFVLEADEYDTAFFDKRAKFVHYFPKLCVLNNLEFDHADIYPDLAAIERQFHHLLRIVPDNGSVIYNQECDAIGRVLKKGCWSHQSAFGLEQGEWQLKLLEEDASHFVVLHQGKAVAEVDWSLIGEHNAMNALAAISAASHAGIKPQEAAKSLASFQSVKRRLEKITSDDNATIYEDFAHHPSAIKATLQALRAHDKQGKILAIVDFASNSMRSGIHNQQLSSAFDAASEVWLYQPKELNFDTSLNLPTEKFSLKVFETVEDIVAAFVAQSSFPQQTVLMSNKAFGGLKGLLLDALSKGAKAVLSN